MFVDMLFDQYLKDLWRGISSISQTRFPADTSNTQLPAKRAVVERQTAGVFETTCDQPAFRLGRCNLMRPPLEMHDHPQGGAPGEAGDEETAGLQYSHHFVKGRRRDR